jgi:hypothetical protein
MGVSPTRANTQVLLVKQATAFRLELELQLAKKFIKGFALILEPKWLTKSLPNRRS